jgi:hypothetical protein
MRFALGVGDAREQRDHCPSLIEIDLKAGIDLAIMRLSFRGRRGSRADRRPGGVRSLSH